MFVRSLNVLAIRRNLNVLAIRLRMTSSFTGRFWCMVNEGNVVQTVEVLWANNSLPPILKRRM